MNGDEGMRYFLMLCLTFMIGCGTTTLTKVNSEPAGANVLLGNKVIGTTPFTYDFSKEVKSSLLTTHEVAIKFQYEGYEEVVRHVRRGKDSVGLNTQLPREVNVILEKK